MSKLVGACDATGGRGRALGGWRRPAAPLPRLPAAYGDSLRSQETELSECRYLVYGGNRKAGR